MEHISTRSVSQRIRRGTLPEIGRGKPHCACHPEHPTYSTTESLRFWSKGDKITCAITGAWAPALAAFPELGIVIDTRL